MITNELDTSNWSQKDPRKPKNNNWPGYLIVLMLIIGIAAEAIRHSEPRAMLIILPIMTVAATTIIYFWIKKSKKN